MYKLDKEVTSSATDKISNTELYTLLKNKFGYRFNINIPILNIPLKFGGIPIYLSDGDYDLPSDKDVKSFVDSDPTSNEVYGERRHSGDMEDFDCDDFAYMLMGNSCKENSSWAFGIIWTEAHAFCIYVNNLKRIMFVEPQSDKILDYIESWQGKSPRFIVM